MATILLSSAGAALGGSMGGTIAGLSSAVLGRAVGATVGRVIDQRLMGQGSDVIATGRVDRFRLMSASEGDSVSQIYGRMRIGGQVIWASDFAETVTTTGGGKGAPSQPKSNNYSYSVNLAVALCEGEVTRIGRIWANGEEIAPDDLNLRLYSGSHEQIPDPLIEAIEGQGEVPAYRGTAYVVMENLDLGAFGNRVPQFSFEVSRPEQPGAPDVDQDPVFGIKGVTLIPGTGEYGLATTPVNYSNGPTSRWSANINTPAQKPDFSVALDTLTDELPNCEAASMVVSWFGDDLRCGQCTIRPKVESRAFDGENMPWSVAGVSRENAQEISVWNGRPIYGGTPTDQSVIEAISAMNVAGKKVMFYPFILMEQLEDNTLENPYDPLGFQPKLPWRGRITTSRAPQVDGTPDGTAAANAEVDAFFGSATAADFTVTAQGVNYSGPDEWRFSRFILHYAALCAAAGGVEAFCIGSEMRGLTQIRGAGNAFIAVARMRRLAAQVRQILGPNVKLSYAADWSEYSGYHPAENPGDRFFHLDPLWADDNIDFIGIDNYMPLSDWRDGPEHLDRAAGSIYDLDYLRSNIAGGEGYDWYYATPDDRDRQIRTPITDPGHNETWAFRYKDIANWWSRAHHDRVNFQRVDTPTAWVPQSKPIWFTEMGCAAINKGTNQPNKFLDAKSSESSLPRYSTGARDDLIQMQYLRAMISYWGDAAHNPVSNVYGGAMVEMSRAFVWALDVRPYPYFPNNSTLWNDGENYARGHWVNGRVSARSLSSVVREICEAAGLFAIDVSKLYGLVRGYIVSEVGEARAALQPLMLRYGFDAVERGGVLVFKMREGQTPVQLIRDDLARSTEMDAAVEQTRSAEAEMSGRVRLKFIQADSDFDVMAEEAVLSADTVHGVSSSEIPIALTRAEGRQVAERWLTEAQVARETVRFALPPSMLGLGAGDVVELPAGFGESRAQYRVDRVDYGTLQLVEAVRIEPEVYVPADLPDELPSVRAFIPPMPVMPLFLDLPLLSGDEAPHAPHIAATSDPWPGNVAVYASGTRDDYQLRTVLGAQAVVGRTQNDIIRAPAGIIDHGTPLEVFLTSGALSSVTHDALLGGANLAAIGDGTPGHWEVFQFQSAELVAPKIYRLSQRLRGQFGSEATVPAVWPEGSWFVLLNGAVDQLPMGRNMREVIQNFRIGPARRPVDDASYVDLSYAFEGNGLRPYAPCHLSAKHSGDGAINMSWIRRTRVDGDSWVSADVPLGEEEEHYRISVVQSGNVVRSDEVSKPVWVYDQAMQAQDNVSGAFAIQVAQVSATFGAGPAAECAVLL